MRHWKFPQIVMWGIWTLIAGHLTLGCNASRADTIDETTNEHTVHPGDAVANTSSRESSKARDTAILSATTGDAVAPPPKKRVFKAFEVNPDEPCDHCEKRFCTRLNNQDYVAGCYEGPHKDTCKAVVACAKKSKCAKTRSADCYCGENVGIGQCIKDGGQGPCRLEIESASLTRDPTEIAARFADPKYPVGRAMALIDCKRSYCPKCNE